MNWITLIVDQDFQVLFCYLQEKTTVYSKPTCQFRGRLIIPNKIFDIVNFISHLNLQYISKQKQELIVP